MPKQRNMRSKFQSFINTNITVKAIRTQVYNATLAKFHRMNTVRGKNCPISRIIILIFLTRRVVAIFHKGPLIKV